MRKLLSSISMLPLLYGALTTPAAAADDPIYTLPGTSVLAEVGRDGRVEVTENHTFTWRQQGHGAYLDIPLTAGVRVDDITVSEAGTAYRRGPDAAVGADRPAGTYGTACCAAARQRVTWYFSAAAGTTRTFTVRYTVRGAVTLYSDQAFLRLPVWGEHWPQTLDALRVEIRLPGGGGPGQGVLESAKDPALKVDATARTAAMTERGIGPGRSRTVELAFPTGLLDGRPASAATAPGSGAPRLAGLRAEPAVGKGWFDLLWSDPARAVGVIVLAVLVLGMVGFFVVAVIAEVREGRARRRAGATGGRSVSSSYGSSASTGSYGGGAGGGSGTSGGGGGGGAW
ncbi:DUF2207 domain-containing protein [Actinomadura sp. ATCC 31491]|uniref:DUF2207 domain-containing protein n=1 Tax=Actinomadura luzonensis TaxID=2805427 RepID=A0ABT0G3I6_9ACTN|nr:DUF2207 domain-containing protein [Actinomadura luzonensis]MCK2219112.1 DUF2207 domain-containing protein [Actinomadura luzonensis]